MQSSVVDERIMFTSLKIVSKKKIVKPSKSLEIHHDSIPTVLVKRAIQYCERNVSVINFDRANGIE